MMGRTICQLALASLLLPACRQGAPSRGDEAAELQAGMTADSAQARLWREVGGSSPIDMTALPLDSPAVRRSVRASALDRPLPEAAEQSFAQSVDAAITMVDAPAVTPPFAGEARIAAISGERFTLDLGEGRTVRVQARVAGGAIRARTGEAGQLFFSHDADPMVAGDRLALRLTEDDLLYALVGNTGLVTLTLPPFRLTARQTEPVAGNTAPVLLTVGTETRTIGHGETATFETGNLTIRVLASIAVRGEAANTLPGEPFRLQLIGWRTRPQR